MRFAALVLSTVWALGVSLAVPCPRSLRLYFAANLVYEAGTQPFLYLYGDTSFAYALAYYIFASLHFLAALNVVRTEFSRRWHLAAGIAVSLAVVWRAYAGMPRPMHSYHLFSLIEGGALALAGTTLVYSAARNARAGIMLTLSLLWLALAFFRMGFTQSLTSETWLRLNHVLPTLFVCAALGWIGLRLIEQRKQVSFEGGGKIE